MSTHHPVAVPRTRSLTVILAALALAAGTTHAAPPPSRISYQGLLSESGVPANGTYNLTFRFFPDAVGGSATELLVNNVGLVPVTDGLFNTTIGIGTITDGASPETFTSIAALVAARSTLFVQVEVNGVAQLPRQQVVSAPYALNARRAETLDNISTADNSIWSVEAGDGNASLTFAGSNLRLQVGDTPSDVLVLQGTMHMLPVGAGSSTAQRLFFSSGGVNTAKSLLWDEAQTRFEFDDDLAISGLLSAGSATSGAPVSFHRIGTGTPISASITGSNDLLVEGDLESLGSIIASSNILMRANAAEGDASIFFREDASDTGEVFRWENLRDKFVMTDALEIEGNFTISDPDNESDIQSTGGITIRIDTDNNDSGPNVGVFSINAHAADRFGTPLLRLQSTDEANLELDNGVVTDAFDYAEAFRATQGQESLEPGDVVTIAIGANQHEHCEQTDEANERVILGVVSTNPAYTAGMSFEAIELADPALTAQRNAARERGDQAEANRVDKLMDTRMREQWKPIAMVGRVQTKVDGRHGPIMAGDILTSSPTPGHAMKLTGPGMALGVALEDFTSAERGTISVFVRPMWHGDPNIDIASLRAENTDLKQRLQRLEAALARLLTSR